MECIQRHGCLRRHTIPLVPSPPHCWLEPWNRRDINVRLHVPTTSLVPPPAGTSARSAGGPSGGSVTIGPLAKHSGEPP